MQSSDGKKDLFSNFKTKQGEFTRLVIHVTVTSGITDMWGKSSKEDGSRRRSCHLRSKRSAQYPELHQNGVGYL